MYEKLSKRGELYEKVGLGHHFMYYTGNIFRYDDIDIFTLLIFEGGNGITSLDIVLTGE